MSDIKSFIRELKSYHPANSLKVYNPWRDFDGIYDIGKEAPEIRRGHLENYLTHRVPHAKYILLAEAVGFQGGHFSGIAMTSERILLGHHKNKKLKPSLAISCDAKRTSNPGHPGINKAQSKMGYNEPTATIVWESILEHERDPFDVILWNMY
ncbi:MAG: uracil-DNA glycosylase, partial [Desulfotomaculaceae bacterium]|nr:uracil-DNA glycosylase [Desulfotomaculaceae bacterium]